MGAAKIVGEDGEEMPLGEVGSVYIADGRPFAYHNDPVKTASAYNDKGWSTVGEIGYLDAEGYLYLTDRKAHNCRARLSPIKCPRTIDFAAELPRTATGKLVKRHLRDRYWPTPR